MNFLIGFALLLLLLDTGQCEVTSASCLTGVGLRIEFFLRT